MKVQGTCNHSLIFFNDTFFHNANDLQLNTIMVSCGMCVMTTHNHNHLAQRNKVLIKFISYHESEEEKEKIIDKHQKKTYHIKCWWKADDRLNANWHPSASSSGPNGHPLPTRMWVCDDKRETNGASTQRGFAIKLSKSSIVAASHTNGCTHCNYCPARGEFAVMLEVEFVWGELESIKALCVIIFGLRTPVWGVRREQQLNLWSNNYVTDSKRSSEVHLSES